jgi:acetyltransferase-like isoleucine patch superfamily enzyme
MRVAIEFLFWLLPPSRVKNFLLRRLGHRISATARIGPTIVLGVRRFEIGGNVLISPGNVVKNLGLARLDDNARIGSWNWISAAPEFQRIDPRAGTLIMEDGATITSRHYLDATGTIVMKPHARIGGGRAFIQTHEPDFDHFRVAAGRIVIGHHSLVGSCAVMLKGAHLPDQSVLAANSTMIARRDDDQRRGVYAGSPARWRRETDGKWFVTTDYFASEFVVDGPMGSLPEASTATDRPEDQEPSTGLASQS